MKKLLLLFILLFFIKALPQTNNEEFRATWVVTWEYISAGSTVDQNKERIRNILDQHKAANMTSVIWQVRQGGMAYYQSSYEPWGTYAGGTYPGFDPLQYVIEEAHKRGLEVHAWFNSFSTTSTAPGTPAGNHPEWICRDQSGNPMTTSIAISPGLDSVRAYNVKVAMEIVRKYDIDGIHLDYVRWNEYTSSKKSAKFSKYAEENRILDGEITEDQIKELEDNQAGRYLYDVDHPYSAGIPAGYSTWEDWWRAGVTKFVKALHDSIQTVKPWVRLSAAALGKYNWSGWNGYSVVYQDAALWFNQGYIDQLTPMHYHWTTGAGFYNMLKGACPECWGQFIQPGIAAGRLFTVGPGSYILDENHVWNNHPEVVNASRTVDWVDGFQFFSYASWKNYNYWNTAGTTFFKKKTKIRGGGFILDTVPSAPSVSIQKLDSLNYKLTVTPPSINKEQWFVVYRSTGTNFSTDTSEIIKVVFSKTPFTVDETFTGTQDFNGKYRYKVTMADRYWNESLLSNMAETDPIPSFAPVVSSSFPGEGDTVQISSAVILNFSKTMDVTTFTDAVTITPGITVTSVLFDQSNKSATIKFNGSLNFNTQYTVKVDSTVKDINGKYLDGNANGIPGDSYYLKFRTVDQDTTGPVIEYSYPYVSNPDSFDVEDAITVIFDEYVDSTTITQNNVILKRGGTIIPAVLFTSKWNNKTILNVRTTAPLVGMNQYSVTVKKEVKDVWGNPMENDVTLNFVTTAHVYSTKTMIDDFNNVTNWEQPEFSGSTSGIINIETNWNWTYTHFLPGTAPGRSGYLEYKWDPSNSVRLIREYLSGGTPRTVLFDTTFTLQVFIYGDGSGNKFRFAIDEGDGTNWPGHEVSTWFTIDWTGWKLVEWKLSDPLMTGSWIGNGILDAAKYRIDSFQMTDNTESVQQGKIYFDNLRAVKKSVVLSDVETENLVAPKSFKLYPNYPNPFNSQTTLSFDINKKDFVNLEVYDVLGRKVAILVNDELEAGHYELRFDASGLSSGKYIYRIKIADQQLSGIMIYLK